MKRSRTLVLKSGLNTLYGLGAHIWLAPWARGKGAVFTLHHVLPDSKDPFAPNRILDITPEFLDAAIKRIKRAGIDLVSLDEAHRRLTSKSKERRFVCFTLDDGYRDNYEYAAPVFRANDCPYTIFVSTSLIDGVAEMWWCGLEKVISEQSAIGVEMDNGRRYFDCAVVDEKYKTYEAVYWWLRGLEEDEKLNAVRELCHQYGVDMTQIARDTAMSWQEVAEIATDPLCTIGAHTVSHAALAKVSQRQLEAELRDGKTILEGAIGKTVDHFAYPYGDPGSAGEREFKAAKDAGFKMAFTTQPGMLTAETANHLMSIPRVSLNGDYQSLHYLDMFLSGVPFMLRGLSKGKQEGASESAPASGAVAGDGGAR